jgi:excisionase family DNA binding protein
MMAKTDKDILTTAETAKLLGVSVRTAQLLVEGGSIPSWKTPGGHRRVYRSDVMAIINGREEEAATANPSAMVVVIGATDRLPLYRTLFAPVGECTVEMFDDVLAALVAVGSLKPHTIIVDAPDGGPDRTQLLRGLSANRALGGSRLLAVGQAASVPASLQPRVTRLDTPEAALEVIEQAIAGDEPVTFQPGDAPFPIARNEGQRLIALERTGLLDTAPEEAFDRLTWLAAQGLDAPIALMTLLTPSRQWFKSRVGLDMTETPRSWAFCNHTILQRDVFSVEDLASDARFADNPAVAGEPGFCFYAGAPVLDPDGFVVGSLCVIDRKPRKLDERGAQMIRTLAAIASDEIRLRGLERQTHRQKSAGSLPKRRPAALPGKAAPPPAP